MGYRAAIEHPDDEKVMVLHVDKIERETNAAVGVLDTNGKMAWFPKSEISINYQAHRTGNIHPQIAIYIPAWIAKRYDALEFGEE